MLTRSRANSLQSESGEATTSQNVMAGKDDVIQGQLKAILASQKKLEKTLSSRMDEMQKKSDASSSDLKETLATYINGLKLSMASFEAKVTKCLDACSTLTERMDVQQHDIEDRRNKQDTGMTRAEAVY